MNDVIWWTAFGAIAQVAGAVATAAAVIVALLLAKAERGLHGRGHVRIMVAIDPSSRLQEYQIHFSLENSGIRPLVWETTSWRSGWLPKLGGKLGYVWALQSDASGSPFTRQSIEPAMTGRVSIPIRILKEAMVNSDERVDLFRRRVPLLGHPPITAFAIVAGRKPIKLKVSKSVADFMRTGDHADYYRS
jgi:hypothetical protein